MSGREEGVLVTVVGEALIDLFPGQAPRSYTAFTGGSPFNVSIGLAGQNLITIGASRALRVLGLEDTVARVGFDDFPLADMLRPGITVVAQDVISLGKLAAEILFRRLDGDRSPFRTHVLPTWLITRGSGEIGPVAVARG